MTGAAGFAWPDAHVFSNIRYTYLTSYISTLITVSYIPHACIAATITRVDMPCNVKVLGQGFQNLLAPKP